MKAVIESVNMLAEFTVFDFKKSVNYESRFAAQVAVTTIAFKCDFNPPRVFCYESEKFELKKVEIVGKLYNVEAVSEFK